MNFQTFVIMIIVLVGGFFLGWTWIKKPLSTYSVKNKALFFLFSAFTIVFGVLATLKDVLVKALAMSLDPNYDLYSLIGFTIFCIAAMYISKEENKNSNFNKIAVKESIINSPNAQIISINSTKKDHLDRIFESRIWVFLSISSILLFGLYVGVMGFILGIVGIALIVYLIDEIIND